MRTDETRRGSLDRLEAEIVGCRACPRLVAWREQVGHEKRAAYRDDDYWARPVPGFGDPDAHLVIVGLAPAAHGANRTGRMFTGDRSGDFLYAALHRAGYANQPTSVSRDDGLRLDGAWITAPVRCAPPQNKPTPTERDACRPFLDRELALLPNARVFLAARRLRLPGAWPVCSMSVPAPVRSRRRGAGAGWPDHPLLVPREPAEHVHRQAHSGHARHGARAGPSARDLTSVGYRPAGRFPGCPWKDLA